MNGPLHVLILEDNPADAELLLHEIQRAGFAPEWRRVETEADFLAELDQPTDVILADYALPGFDGLRALVLVRERGLDTPFILVSGKVGEEPAVEAIQRGANDYLLKDRLARLGPAVRRALEEQRLRDEHRRAEEALRHAQTQLHQLLSHSPAVLYTLKIEGEQATPILCSDNIRTLFGYEVAEVLQPDWFITHLHPEDRERVMACFRETLAGGPGASEFRFRHQDGSWRWVTDRQRVYRDAAGQPREVVGVWMDITQPRQAELALAEEAVRRRILIEQSSDGIVVLDEDGAVHEANRRYAEMLGYSPAEVRQLHVWDWDTQWNREQILAMIRAVDETGAHFETRHRRKDGTVYDVEISISGTLVAGRKLVFCVCRDISARKRAEAALRESEERFRTLFESALVSIFLHNAETGEIVQANRKAIESYGLRTLEELQRSEFWIEPPYSAADSLRWIRLAASEGPQRFEWKNRDIHGRVFWEDALLSGVMLNGKQHVLAVTHEITVRKQAEQALADERNLLRTILDNLPDLVFTKDLEARVVLSNAAAERFLGRSEVQMAGRSAFDLNPTELAEGYQQDDHRVLREGVTVCNREEQICSHAGERHWFLTTKAPLRNRDGQTTGLVAICRDITERKRADEAIKLFRELVDRSNDAIEVLDPETGRFLDVNEKGCLDLGYTREEFLNLTVFDIDPRVDLAVFKRSTERLRESGSVLWEGIHQRKDGSTFPVEVNIKHVRLDRDYLVATVRDTTERKRAEQQLRKLARAVEQSPVSIVITDLAGNIEFVNPKFTQATGYSPEEAIGKNPRFLKSGEKPEEEYRQMWETINTGGEWRGIFHNKRKDGSLFWETACISAMHDDAGEITHFIAVKEDVTEKRLTEAKLLRAQRMESIGSLASGIAHDLNNILTAILMCAPLLHEDDSPENRRELAGTIESSAQRAAGVVRQLLGFARGHEGPRGPVQVRHLVRDMAKLARETFPRNIQIKEVYAPELWPVRADATQLHQVLLNLCVNARDALPAGGQLILRVDNVTMDEHYAAMHPEASVGPHVRLRVEDTGTGIPAAVQEHIFESFFTTKCEGEGTGLGLTTVQGIVRDHGGFITFTSREGRGTTFEIHLPAAPEAASGQTPAVMPEAVPQGGGELILVVDDEPSIRETTRRTLERNGYTVLTAQDGIEALTLFTTRRDEIRAVLTDVMMPLMDGITLCRALKRLSPGTPLIVSSGGLFGEAGGAQLRALEQLGVAHVLHKPHNADVLLRTLHLTLAAAKTAPGV